ncbi:hypothetical protein TYRP_012761 [Tyrophagus putrescentiae]|nr:hypothetical protein TYRP_012761 [Tyrophagus putrescentiae]
MLVSQTHSVVISIQRGLEINELILASKQPLLHHRQIVEEAEALANFAQRPASDVLRHGQAGAVHQVLHVEVVGGHDQLVVVVVVVVVKKENGGERSDKGVIRLALTRSYRNQSSSVDVEEVHLPDGPGGGGGSFAFWALSFEDGCCSLQPSTAIFTSLLLLSSASSASFFFLTSRWCSIHWMTFTRVSPVTLLSGIGSSSSPSAAGTAAQRLVQAGNGAHLEGHLFAHREDLAVAGDQLDHDVLFAW